MIVNMYECRVVWILLNDYKVLSMVEEWHIFKSRISEIKITPPMRLLVKVTIDMN